MSKTFVAITGEWDIRLKKYYKKINKRKLALISLSPHTR